MSDLSEQVALAQVQERLIGRYLDVPPDQIVAAIRNSEAHFETSPIRDFVPLLVERRAVGELRVRRSAATSQAVAV